VFKYIWSNVFLQATAGPSLGGWPHPQHRVSPMNFDPVIEDLRVDSSGDDYNLGLHGCLWRFTVTPVNFSMSSTTAAAAAASETAIVAAAHLYFCSGNSITALQQQQLLLLPVKQQQ
jgi:hypothetical protein